MIPTPPMKLSNIENDIVKVHFNIILEKKILEYVTSLSEEINDPYLVKRVGDIESKIRSLNDEMWSYNKLRDKFVIEAKYYEVDVKFTHDLKTHNEMLEDVLADNITLDRYLIRLCTVTITFKRGDAIGTLLACKKAIYSLMDTQEEREAFGTKMVKITKMAIGPNSPY